MKSGISPGESWSHVVSGSENILTHRSLHGHVDFLGTGAVSLKEEVSLSPARHKVHADG